MTPGNNGASTPEGDDPFGYLYADGQAAGATPPSGGGGYGYPGPNRSYNQVRTVGERQYGAPQPPQGQAPPQQAPPAYGANHYAAPETLAASGGVRQGPPPGSYDQSGGHGGGRGRGPNTKGLLIGAIAVVAAVLIGIGVAMTTGDDDKGDDQAAGTGSGQDEKPAESTGPDDSDGDKGKDEDKEKDEDVDLPKADAKSLTLAGGTRTASDYDGAESAGGVYVAGLNKPGASATWTVNDIAEAGKYTLYVRYSVPGKDAFTTLTVNGKAQTRPLNMKNFANAEEGKWEKGWTSTWANLVLNKGTNTLKVSCEQGDKCEADLDKVWLVKGWPKS